MAIELITGKAGTPHIDSADVGAYQAYTVGAGVYILNGCTPIVNSANSITITAGEILAEGRHVRVKGTGETVSIGNGQSGYKRIDVITAHYTRNSSGIESVAIEVVKGTPTTGTPATPAMPNAGKVLEEATDVYWPLYAITLDGLSPQTPEYVGGNLPSGIEAYGVSNDWTWVKYSNGMAGMWRNFRLADVANAYVMGAGVALPFAVYDGIPIVSQDPGDNSSISTQLHPKANMGTTTSVAVYVHNPFGSTPSGAVVYLNLLVIGRWK